MAEALAFLGMERVFALRTVCFRNTLEAVFSTMKALLAIGTEKVVRLTLEARVCVVATRAVRYFGVACKALIVHKVVIRRLFL